MTWVEVLDDDGNTALVTEKNYERSFKQRGYRLAGEQDSPPAGDSIPLLDIDGLDLRARRALAADRGIDVPTRANGARVVALLREYAEQLLADVEQLGIDVPADATEDDVTAELAAVAVERGLVEPDDVTSPGELVALLRAQQ